MDMALAVEDHALAVILSLEILGTLIRHAVLGFGCWRTWSQGIWSAGILGMIVARGRRAALADMGLDAVTVIAVIGSVLLSCLELFVAFLQAYVFVFLSALFIGASIHKH